METHLDIIFKKTKKKKKTSKEEQNDSNMYRNTVTLQKNRHANVLISSPGNNTLKKLNRQ